LKRAMINCAFVFLTAALALSGSYASADQTLYRWTDEAGNPVNSDRPPPTGVEYEVISTSSSMVRKVDADEGAVPLEVKPSASNDFEQVQTSKPKIEKNAEYCQRARDNLQSLDTSARIRLRDEQGEYRYIDEAEKAEQRERARDTIALHCEE
jgi:hypothetical protein